MSADQWTGLALIAIGVLGALAWGLWWLLGWIGGGERR